MATPPNTTAKGRAKDKTCSECGAQMANLSMHMRMKHGVTPSKSEPKKPAEPIPTPKPSEDEEEEHGEACECDACIEIKLNEVYRG